MSQLTPEELNSLFSEPAHIPTAAENNLQAQTFTTSAPGPEEVFSDAQEVDYTDPIDMIESLPAEEVADLAIEAINMGISTFFPDLYAKRMFSPAELQRLKRLASTGQGGEEDRINAKILSDYCETMIPPEEKTEKLKKRLCAVIENLKIKISPEWALAITAGMAYAPAYLPLLKKPLK